jgi:hypothetical protein
MTEINPKDYPYPWDLPFDTQSEGKKCFTELKKELSRVYDGHRVYDGKCHHQYDYMRIEFAFKTRTDKEEFSKKARDITSRLLGDDKGSKIAA